MSVHTIYVFPTCYVCHKRCVCVCAHECVSFPFIGVRVLRTQACVNISMWVLGREREWGLPVILITKNLKNSTQHISWPPFSPCPLLSFFVSFCFFYVSFFTRFFRSTLCIYVRLDIKASNAVFASPRITSNISWLEPKAFVLLSPATSPNAPPWVLLLLSSSVLSFFLSL